jgi:hypothetical protein
MIRVIHPGSGSRTPGPDSDLLTLPDPGIPDPVVQKAPDPGSKIRIRNTGKWM